MEKKRRRKKRSENNLTELRHRPQRVRRRLRSERRHRRRSVPRDPVQEVVGREVAQGREGPQRVRDRLRAEARQQRRCGGDEPDKRLGRKKSSGACRAQGRLQLGEAVQSRGDVDLVEHVHGVGDGVEDLRWKRLKIFYVLFFKEGKKSEFFSFVFSLSLLNQNPTLLSFFTWWNAVADASFFVMILL